MNKCTDCAVNNAQTHVLHKAIGTGTQRCNLNQAKQGIYNAHEPVVIAHMVKMQYRIDLEGTRHALAMPTCNMPNNDALAQA